MNNDANEHAILARVAKVIFGHPFRGRIKDDPDGDVRVVQMKDVDPEKGVDWSGMVRTGIQGRRKPDWLGPGDVLFLTRGDSNFAICLNDAPVRTVASPHFFLLRVKYPSELLPEFLSWQINQAPARRYLDISAEGTLQRSIRKGVLEQLPVTVPDMATQKAAVKAAHCIDGQIAIYRKHISNCERQIQAVADKVLTGKRR